MAKATKIPVQEYAVTLELTQREAEMLVFVYQSSIGGSDMEGHPRRDFTNISKALVDAGVKRSENIIKTGTVILSSKGTK